jgi:predicted dehydrogenase
VLNAAIIGLGRWGRRLVDSVQQAGSAIGSDIRFTRAVVRDEAKAAAYAATQGLHLGSSYAEVLSDPDVEAIVLATPHSLHTEQIVAAAAAGKHVFVEKPFALRLDAAEQAAAAIRGAELALALGHNRRFLPAAQELKALVERGDVGKILHVDGNFSNNSGGNYTKDMWRSKESGAMSAMTAMGIHVLDFFIFLNGRIKSVRTHSTNLTMPVDVDDVVSVHLTFESGAYGSLRTMLATPRRWGIEVFGTRGWAEMADEHLLNVQKLEGSLEQKTFEMVDSVRLELQAFARAATYQEPYPLPLSDAVHGAAAFEAILTSAESGGVEVEVRHDSFRR